MGTDLKAFVPSVSRRAVLAVCLATGVLVVTAAPAYATVQKSGSQSCGSGLYVELVGKGQGNISFYLPSGTLRYSEHHSTIYTGYYRSNSRSASWTVSSDDILVDSGTYATCVPGAAPSA